jgi:RNA polymerase sigma-54 factor
VQIQKPVLRQQQRLKLTPQLFQAIKIMSLPLQELRLKIEEELVSNPALEVLEDRSTVSLEDVTRGAGEEYSVFEETSDSGYTSYGQNQASDNKRLFIEGVLTRPESLKDHLIWQLRLQPIDENLFRIGELIIRNLDDNGFHREKPASLVKEEEWGVLGEMIRLIQSFDPQGVATADYKESLQAQIRNHADAPALSSAVVEDHLEALEKGKYEEIARKLKISEKEVRDITVFIGRLDPLPGRNYATEPPRYVIPDILVKLKEGEIFIVLNDEEIPVLGINPFFEDINQKKSRPDKKGLKKYVRANINNARWFIRSIGQRNDTLLKVCRVVVEFQRNFFRDGPKQLAPLTLKDIAKEIGVHEATVSRITTGKYMQTEWGIFELKYFFSNSISGPGSGGSRYSKQGVKEIIKEIIEAEGAAQLTDQRISEILAGRGINIARRTVSKYRRELDIRSSFQR